MRQTGKSGVAPYTGFVEERTIGLSPTAETGNERSGRGILHIRDDVVVCCCVWCQRCYALAAPQADGTSVFN